MNRTIIAIAHYGLDRQITREECEAALEDDGLTTQATVHFVDFKTGENTLSELYDAPFENMALGQQRKFNQDIQPLLKTYPDAHIAYFGYNSVSMAFHFGYLLGNTHSYTVFQWHHALNKWYSEIAPPKADYTMEIQPIQLPTEIQKGDGRVVIRIGTSFYVDPQATYEVIRNPENEFDIALATPHPDVLYSQENIQKIVDAFQDVLNTYANKLLGRSSIHLFIASSVGLPFALGTRINSNIYPYVQTYQYNKSRTPVYKEAITIAAQTDEQVNLTEEETKKATTLRKKWAKSLEDKIIPFVKSKVDASSWLEAILTKEDYKAINPLVKIPWDSVIPIYMTSLKEDAIDLKARNIDGGFSYDELKNSWLLDDGFLVSVEKRFARKPQTDFMQAGRLFLFHESLHYSTEGHRLNAEIATGIGQFPKVIEEADYQADVWALLHEYSYCQLYEAAKLKEGIKQFFCNAIDTAVETMWSFLDNGKKLERIQIRSMNRFLNWYWQWLRISQLKGQGTLVEVIQILLDKPIIELAGAPMTLVGHRTYYKLMENSGQPSQIQLAIFVQNRVRRFAPTQLEALLDGFRLLDGEKVKQGLRSFLASIN